MAVWLEDVVVAIEEIKEYTLPFQGYEEFEKNSKTVDAEEKSVEKISEALKKAHQRNRI
jgi:uncharacterized protein with HEPN domain